MSYKAIITAETAVMATDLRDLNSILARTNWYLRALGLSPDQRKALMEIRRFLSTLMTLRAILTATSIGSAVGVGALRLAGMGRYVPVRDIKTLWKVAAAK